MKKTGIAYAVLKDMGRADLIGTADWQLVPAEEKKKGYRYVQKSKLNGAVDD